MAAAGGENFADDWQPGGNNLQDGNNNLQERRDLAMVEAEAIFMSVKQKSCSTA